MPKPKGIDDPQALWNQDPKAGLNPLYKFATIWGGVATPITRCGFGVRALQPYIFTLILMFGFCGFGRCPQFFLYLPVWLAFVTYRLATIDPRQHSQQRGWPWLACLIPGVNTFEKGRLVEALIIVALGIALKDYHENLALFIFGSGVSLLVVLHMEKIYWRNQRIAIGDAENLAGQYRKTM